MRGIRLYQVGLEILLFKARKSNFWQQYGNRKSDSQKLMNNTSIINNSWYIIYTKMFKIDLSGASGNDARKPWKSHKYWLFKAFKWFVILKWYYLYYKPIVIDYIKIPLKTTKFSVVFFRLFWKLFFRVTLNFYIETTIITI